MEIERLNIVVILADQLTASAMSCAGNPHVNTPHLDRLAANGTRFENAYCAQPLCTPSRASLLTGLTPTQVNARGNGQRLHDVHITASLGQIFSASGYDCGYAGKWHLPELDAPEYSGFRPIHPETEQGLTDSCGAFLREPRTKPFLLVAALTEPHGICEWARGQNPPSGFLPPASWDELPPLLANYPAPAYEAEMPRIAAQHTRHTTPTIDWAAPQWRQYLHAYYRLCERADALVGELLEHLETSGDAENTLIVFSADHGDQMGAHGWSQKWVLYEESINVPLIVVEPGHDQPGQVRSELVNTGLDLLPTLAAAAGIQPPPDRTGQSLLAKDQDTPWRSHVFTETMWTVPGLQNMTGRSVRDGNYKYTCYAWGQYREQLVDLHTDPGELQNLAHLGSSQDLLNSMRETLREESLRVGDSVFARFIPGKESGPV